MKTLLLNLIDKNKSDIKYHIDRYPDGQIQLVLENLDDNKLQLNILTRICSSDDLFILMQLSDIISRRGLSCHLNITYLLAARTDRLFNWSTSFTLKLVMDVLNMFNSKTINILDPHSNAVYNLSNNLILESDFLSYLNESDPDFFGNAKDDIIIVSSDEGAKERLGFKMRNNPYLFKWTRPIIHCNKVRDEFGKVSKVEVNADSAICVNKKSRLIVIDDLCDGGGTFLAIHPELKKLEPSEIDLVITHSIQKSGIEKVSKLYDRVITSNSYNNWDESELPDNVTVVDVVSIISNGLLNN